MSRFDVTGKPFGKDAEGKVIKKEIKKCHTWPSFFQLPVLMLMLITLLTDGALISVGYDIVRPNPIPEQWNLARLFIVATVMGGVSLGAYVVYAHWTLRTLSTHLTKTHTWQYVHIRRTHSDLTKTHGNMYTYAELTPSLSPALSGLFCILHQIHLLTQGPCFLSSLPLPLPLSSCSGSSLLLLAAGLESNNPNGMYAGLGLPPLEYGQVINSIFLKVSVSEFLTLFSCRTQEGFFWTVPPGKPLLGAVFVSLLISSMLASFWPAGELEGLPVKGLALGACPLMPLWVWIFCILWWFVQDLLKVLTLGFLNYFHLFPNYLADMSRFENAIQNVV